MKKIKGEKKQPIKPLIGNVPDYNFYTSSIKEKICWFIVGFIITGVVLFIFYENIYVVVIGGIIGGIVFNPIQIKRKINKRKNKLLLQFKDLLEALSTSIGAGKNIYESFISANNDLRIQYNDDDYIVLEVQNIIQGLNNNIQIEDLLSNLAQRSSLDDIASFASVFSTCYSKGANIKDVIKKTTSVINDKIEIQMEIETMVSGQKNEQNIMMVMPVIFVLVLKMMGGGLLDLKSPVGIISVTIAIVIFVLAYFVSRKILNIRL